MTQTINVSQARQEFGRLLNKVFRKEARVIVEKSGIPVAAIISAQDLQLLQRLEEQRKKDFAILDEIGEAFKDVPDEELEREVTRALNEARAKARADKARKQPGASTP
jgi:prevent-host-death family protein